jgi:hypothetical protein
LNGEVSYLEDTVTEKELGIVTKGRHPDIKLRQVFGQKICKPYNVILGPGLPRISIEAMNCNDPICE